MCKTACSFVSGVAVGVALIMAYLHRDVIVAAVKGEKIPDAPEGCPAYKAE